MTGVRTRIIIIIIHHVTISTTGGTCFRRHHCNKEDTDNRKRQLQLQPPQVKEVTVNGVRDKQESRVVEVNYREETGVGSSEAPYLTLT